jgi:O-antigen/teichoic acid export membrane protein
MKLYINSSIYVINSLLQKGIAFILIPLITRYLNPEQYGIVTIVNILVLFLTVLFTFSLDASIIRFYFDFKDDMNQLRDFFSTIYLVSVLLIVFFIILSVVFFSSVFTMFLKNVTFFPFIFIGIVTILFQALYRMSLVIFQAQQKALKYTLLSLVFFFVNILALFYFVFYKHDGARGFLLSTLLSNVIACLISLVMIRKFLVLKINLRVIPSVLKYSLSIIPSNFAALIYGFSDRILLNNYSTTSNSGIYQISSQVTLPMELIAGNVNKAFTPMYFDNVGKGEYNEPVKASLNLTGLYVTVALAISLFSPEIFRLFIDKSYANGVSIMTYLAFGLCLNAIYYFFVNILFYDRSKTRYVAIPSIVAAVANICLNIILIPHFGILGAAVTNLFSYFLSCLITGIIGHRFELVKWPYFKMFYMFIGGFVIAIIFTYQTFSLSFMALLTVKLMIMILFIVILKQFVLKINFSGILSMVSFKKK